MNNSISNHVICLQETGLMPETKTRREYKLKVKGYHNPIRVDKGGGSRGIATLIRDDINYELVKKGVEKWGEFITVKLVNEKENPLTITNVYVHNGVKTKDINFIDFLIDIEENNHLITGDFNGHNTIWGSRNTDSRGRHIGEKMIELGLECLNTGEITRVSQCRKEGNTTPDVSIMTMTNDIENITWRTENNSLGSDHLPQVITMERNYSKQYDPPTLLRYKTNKANWPKYNTQIGRQDWENIVTDNNTETLDRIDKQIQEVAKSTIPNNSKQLTGNTNQINRIDHRKTSFWWDKECDELTATRRSLENQWKKTGLDIDLANFNKAKNKCTNTFKQKKKKALNDHTRGLNINSRPRETFRTIKAIDGKNPGPCPIAPLKDETGKLATTDKDKANILANHYFKVSSDNSLEKSFLEQRDKNKEKNIKLRTKRELDDQPYNSPITLKDFNEALRYKRESAPGHDSLTYKMLEHLPINAKKAIVKWMNNVFQQGHNPDKIKTAIITPILKPEKEPSQPGSYRPVSLTSHIGKVLETIVNNRLNRFLEHKGIINPHQSGFRQGRSTMEQVVALETEIRSANLGRKSSVLGVFLDMEKAFDIMCRNNLLELLDKYGITGQMYNYILDFLQNRTFRVKVGNALSDMKTQENGIPQGSVISATLFGISVNEVRKQINDKQTKHGQFADDICIYKSIARHGTAKSGLKTIETQVNNVIHYLKKRGFKINESKTQMVLFGTENEAKIKIGGTIVHSKPEARYLGVTLDKHLKYKTHIQQKTKEGHRALNVLYLLGSKKVKAPQSTLKAIYKSIVEGRTGYGSEVFQHGDKTALKQLDGVQAKALRILTGATRNTNKRAIEAITSEPPPDIKRQTAQLTLWARTHLKKDNPVAYAMDEVKEHKMYFKKRANVERGTSRKIKENLEYLDITSDMITNIPDYPSTHIWKSVDIDTGLKKVINKKVDNAVVMKTITQEHIQAKYKDHKKVFTDGSRDSGYTGLGIWSKDYNYNENQRTTDHVAIATVELTAIAVTLEKLEREQIGKTVILSDSLSGLQALERENPKNRRFDIIARIMIQYNKLIEQGHTIAMCWIPAHINIEGNEKADQLAKMGTRRVKIDQDIKLGYTEIKAIIKNRIRALIWNKQWQDMTGLTKELIPQIGEGRIKYGRGKLEKITRLRAQNPYFAFARHWKDIQCETCKTEKTINHVLMNCKTHERQRVQLKRVYAELNIPFNIFNLLAPEGDKRVKGENIRYINNIEENI